MTTKLFETALGIESPWYVRDRKIDIESCHL
jgi:hypothetical protein